jgi:uncharacterized iron-regulated membrane protein
MPVAIVLIIGVVIIAIVLIGIIWSFLLLVPFYAFVGLAGFLIWRSRRKEAEIAAEVEREAQRQRLLNEQETRAWQASLQRERREKILRRFDSTRDPSDR